MRHPVEVGAEDGPHLTAWLSKRLQADVRPPDLGAAGRSELRRLAEAVQHQRSR